MKSICLIVPYIGKLNDFFKLWLKTAEANETIGKNANIVKFPMRLEFITLMTIKIKV